jgi:hypothetical protein|nr:MAG TPA: restriction alleviation protein [Caudoviricetes sp.]
MDDYISWKVLEDKLNKEYANLLLDTVEVDPFVEGFVSAINVVKCTANAADVVPVRYCPFCGAKMDLEGDHEGL